MKIYTLTLNPAYDVHARANELKLQKENLASVISREAGGKGVNISRALVGAGVENTAVVVLGKENAEEFRAALSSDGIRGLYLQCHGRIRENLTFHTADGTETRISFSGFSVDASVLEEIDLLLEITRDTVVTFTGRIPNGIAREDAVAFLLGLRSRGARLVLDSKSLTLEDIYQLQPWLIKPNQEELSEYFGTDVRSLSEAAEKARIFSHHGVCNTMVSLGAQGALLIRDDELLTAVPPRIQAVSTIGAGDSTIAGFLTAAATGADAAGCLRSAVAFGTAACLTPGSRPPRQEDVQGITPRITLSR